MTRDSFEFGIWIIETPSGLKMPYSETGMLWLDDIRIKPITLNTNPVEAPLLPDIRHQMMMGFSGAVQRPAGLPDDLGNTLMDTSVFPFEQEHDVLTLDHEKVYPRCAP